MSESPVRMLSCGKYRLSLDRPLVMGIVNLTPDSFSGDGLGGDVRAAVAHARLQVEAGADILDLGAESSRPGAPSLPLEDELARLIPVLEAVTALGVPVSVDTYKPEVMRRALAAGADMINDIRALTMAGALEAVAGSDCAVCLMHMRGDPATMQQAPLYDDVVAEVGDFLAHRAAEAMAAGVGRERIVIDPGFGFGKTLEHNIALFRNMPRLIARTGVPMLAGVSRKSMLGLIAGRERPAERVAASAAAAMLAARKGAGILRVHDVAATRDALAVLAALDGEEK